MLSSSTLMSLLLAVPAVLLLCQLAGWAAVRLGQPAVIGEILTGILLGPSLLWGIAPQFQHGLLPPEVLPLTSALGNLALLVFLFLIGLELDLQVIRRARSSVIGVSLGSLVLPLLLGAGLAAVMYPRFAPPGTGRLPFVLFVAVSLSITAFPVLARILTERDLQGSHLGSVVMAAAAANDAIAWCLLTAVVALAAAGTALSALVTIALVAALALALVLIRPFLRGAVEFCGRRSDELVLVILCAGLWLSAGLTDWIGVHPAFGAFLFGVVAPRALPAVERSAARLRAVLLPVLLPLYFIDIGLHTNLGDLSWGQWSWAVVILIVAVIGKWGGATAAGLLTGEGWRWSNLLGILMNCRGLTELIVLGIGREIGVISGELFSILVLMALITTVATGPLLNLVLGYDPDDPRTTPADPRQNRAALPQPLIGGADPARAARPDPVLDAVLTRRSVLDLAAPAPDHEELVTLVQAAATAPDHGMLRPWRLIVIDGDDRIHLGQALRDAADTHEQAGRAAQVPLRAPMLLTIVFCPDLRRTKVPEWEQLAATVTMTQTLLLLLHSRGWGAIWRTGPAIEAPQVRDHLDLSQDEQLLGWLYIGTPPNDQPAPNRPFFDARTRISRSRQPVAR